MLIHGNPFNQTKYRYICHVQRLVRIKIHSKLRQKSWRYVYFHSSILNSDYTHTSIFFEWTEKSRKIELNFVFIIGSDFPTKWRVNCSIKTKLKTKTGKTTTNEWSAVHEISSKCTYRLCATEYLQWQRIQSTGRVYLKYPTSS